MAPYFPFSSLQTRLNQLRSESSFFKGIFNTPGSFQLRGLIHRGAAIVLITLTLVHTVFVLSSKRARKDLVDVDILNMQSSVCSPGECEAKFHVG